MEFDVNRIKIYLRKSRSDDANASVEDVLSRHEAILQEYAVKHFGESIAERNIYREIVSGETIEARPEMKKILAAVSNNECDAVLVVEPQRLSRGDMLDCGTVIRVFKYTNTKVLTPSKIFDLADKYDRKFFEMDLQQGNEYLEYVKFILNRGRLASVREGNFIGNTAPFGYDKCIIDGHHTLKPNKDAPTVKLMFDLFVNHGMGTTKIAYELARRGIKPQKVQSWNPASIRDMLKNVTYTGKVKWYTHREKITVDENGATRKIRVDTPDEALIYDGLHQAIIDEATFLRAQQIFGSNTREREATDLVNPFATLVYCGTCGYSMSYRTYKNKQGFEKTAPRLLCTHQTSCHTPSVAFSTMLCAVLQALRSNLEDFRIKARNDEGNSLNLQKELLSSLRTELNSLEEQQSKLYDLLEKGIYTEELFTKRNNVLAKERQRLIAAIDKQERELPKSVNYEERTIRLEQCIQALEDETIPPKYKNELLKSIIKRIDYYADNSRKGNRYHPTEFTINVTFK